MSIWLVIGSAIALLGTIIVVSVIRRRRAFWSGSQPYQQQLIHLDAAMAVRPTVLGHTPSDGYRLSCLFFGTGLIDRTGRTTTGLPLKAATPIPSSPARPDADGRDFARLCDDRARDIVGRARREGSQIHLLWSGGIDSTCACVSLLRALGDQPRTSARGNRLPNSELDRLIIYETQASVSEYKSFSKTVLGRRLKRKRISHVGEAFGPDAITVTGELGDQLFGSAKALRLPVSRLREDWRSALPAMLREELGSDKRARSAYAFLQPHIDRAPVPITDLFSCLWWLNFSLKWQAVQYRMFSSTRRMTFDIYKRQTVHFFDTPDFQSWALGNAGLGIRETWSTYKWPARQVITEFTGDTAYAATKAKVPSLKGLLKPRVYGAAIALDPTGTLLYQPRDLSLRQDRSAGDDGSGFSVSFEAGSDGTDVAQAGSERTDRTDVAESDELDVTRENPLWDDIGDGE